PPAEEAREARQRGRAVVGRGVRRGAGVGPVAVWDARRGRRGVGLPPEPGATRAPHPRGGRGPLAERRVPPGGADAARRGPGRRRRARRRLPTGGRRALPPHANARVERRRDRAPPPRAALKIAPTEQFVRP